LGDYRPTDQSYQVFEQVHSQIQAQTDAFAQLVENDLPAFNAQVAAANLGAVVARPM